MSFLGTLSWVHWILLALLALTFLPKVWRYFFSDPVVTFESDDPAILESVNQARLTLPEFWQKFESQREAGGLFALKVAFDVENGGREHVWIVPASGAEWHMNGVLLNRTQYLKKYEGESVDFTENQITDWLIIQNEFSEGGYSIRAMIRKLPDAQAREMAELHRIPFPLTN